jgi:hypothetical protein
MVTWWVLGCLAVVGQQVQLRAGQPEQPPAAEAAETGEWKPLFDGKSLDGWTSTKFGGESSVEVEDGQIVLGMGSSLTGVTFTGEAPRTNYEISLQAKKVEGIDFFCGLTFPVDDSHCSLIVGGWAGAVVGLSSIDGRDASENETTRYMTFKRGQWYRVRVRVTPAKIEAWIDEQQVVDQKLEGHQISTRNEVVLSKPLGIAAYETKAALRDIKIRRLDHAAPRPQAPEPTGK